MTKGRCHKNIMEKNILTNLYPMNMKEVENCVITWDWKAPVPYESS